MTWASRRTPGGALWLLAALAGMTLLPAPEPGRGEQVSQAPAETAVLLHGYARTSRSLGRMAQTLEREGFRVVNIEYSSLKPFDELADQLADELERCCSEGAGTVHFVTHSMGGILLRYFLATREFGQLGRVVMLSPPNHDTQVVDLLRRARPLGAALGPAARQLGTEPFSLPNRLGPAEYPLGVITGNRSINPLFSSWIPGEDDGQVGVESAKLEGMTDFLVVPRSHSFIVTEPKVIDQTVHFLRHGLFAHEEADSEPR